MNYIKELFFILKKNLKFHLLLIFFFFKKAQASPLPNYIWTGPLLNEELKLLSLNLSNFKSKQQNLTFLKPIQQSGSLYFIELQNYHEGSYECTVRNAAGEEKVQLNLHVLGKFFSSIK